MPRGKNSAKSQKDGQHRKETKEEKALRLKTQREAREVSIRGVPFFHAMSLLILDSKFL